MTSTTKILSYAALIEFLEVHKSASAKQLRDRLDYHDLPSSEPTFERLKSDLKNFGVFLIYQDNNYRLELRENPHQSTFFHVINLIKEVNVFQHLIVDGEAREKVILESKEPPKFYDLIAPIFHAINDKKKIRFDYHQFIKGMMPNLELNPLLLKEYKRRWYVIGYSEYVGENRTFAIDRINNLVVQDTTFKFKGYKDLAQKVSEAFGINYSNELIKLVIKAYSPQDDYIRNLPLHDSQKENELGKGFTIFEYHLRPNYELEQELMKLSDQVSVIEPKELRDEIRNRLSKGIEMNNS